MGYIRHNAIIITSWNRDEIDKVAHKASSLGLSILGPSLEVVNGYRTLLICPDGSKEGWDHSNTFDDIRLDFCAWLNEQRYSDGSSSLEWAEIAYSNDEKEVTIERTAWDSGNEIN